MKKFKKFLRSPLRFIRDMRLVACPYVPDLEGENVFIVSHLGQLRQAEYFIKREGLDGCVLCVLYTIKNMKMPKLVLEAADRSLYLDVFISKIPAHPNVVNIESLIYIKRLYKRLLKKISPRVVYVFSFEGHYSLLLNLCERKAIKKHLIEEGTATYKLVGGVNLSPAVKHSFHSFLIKKIWFFSSLRPSLSEYRDFDAVSAAFPELVRESFPNSDVKFMFNAPSEKIESLTFKERFTKGDMIFVSQRYGADPVFFWNLCFDAIIRLIEGRRANLFIKLHPKENVENVALVESKIKSSGLDDKVFVIKDVHSSIEPLVARIQPENLVGITSSVLVYANLLSPKTKVISIAPYVIKRIDNAFPDLKRELENHLLVLERFKSIQYFKGPSSC